MKALVDTIFSDIKVKYMAYLDGIAVGQKIEPIASRASAFTFVAENPHRVEKVQSGIRLAFIYRNMQ